MDEIERELESFNWQQTRKMFTQFGKLVKTPNNYQPFRKSQDVFLQHENVLMNLLQQLETGLEFYYIQSSVKSIN